MLKIEYWVRIDKFDRPRVLVNSLKQVCFCKDICFKFEKLDSMLCHRWVQIGKNRGHKSHDKLPFKQENLSKFEDVQYQGTEQMLWVVHCSTAS